MAFKNSGDGSCKLIMDVDNRPLHLDLSGSIRGLVVGPETIPWEFIEKLRISDKVKITFRDNIDLQCLWPCTNVIVGDFVAPETADVYYEIIPDGNQLLFSRELTRLTKGGEYNIYFDTPNAWEIDFQVVIGNAETGARWAVLECKTRDYPL